MIDSSFDEFVHGHIASLERYAYALTSDRHAADDMEVRAIYDVQYVLGFAADVKPFAIRRRYDAVRVFRNPDFAGDLVGPRVDDGDVVARAVGDINSKRRGGQRERGKERQPFHAASNIHQTRNKLNGE